MPYMAAAVFTVTAAPTLPARLEPVVADTVGPPRKAAVPPTL
jgi:hypothetical protein